MARLEYLPMTKTELRVRELALEHVDFGSEPNLEAGLDESGISSDDAGAFIKKVGEAFGVAIPPEALAEFKNMRALAAYIDSRTA